MENNFHIVGTQPGAIVRRAKTLPPWDEEDFPHVFSPVLLAEVLEETYETDAHFVPYFVEGEEEWPACAKNMLGLVEREGGRILTSMAVLDFDTEPHQPWTDQGLVQFSDRMQAAKEAGEVPFPQVLYTTAKGARGIFLFSEYISVAKVEPIIRGLVQVWDAVLSSIPVKADNLCNWDRCFRLPKVTRDGRITSTDPHFHLFHEPMASPFVPGDLPSSGREACTMGGTPVELNLPMPTPEEVENIINTVGSRGRVRESNWYRQAKSRMRGRDYWHACFDEDPTPPPEGKRDTEIQKAAGGVVSMCIGLPGASPEKCFALLFNWVDQIHPDTCDVPPRDNLWKAVLKYWAKEEAKLEEAEKEIQTKTATLVEKYREWDPDLPKDPEEARDYIERRRLVKAGRHFHILQDDGRYSRRSVSPEALRGEIARLGMQDLIQLEELQGNAVHRLSWQEILERQGIEVNSVISEWGIGSGCIVQKDGRGGYNLVMPGPLLNTDLEPRFDEEVDTWLRKMFDSDYPEVENWIVNALEINDGKPICALSIQGPSGCGKGLLVRGITECFIPSFVVGGVAFHQFNASMLDAAVIHIDEGWPADLEAKGNIPDLFRGLVSAEPKKIQVKFHPDVDFRGAPRIILTSNSDNLLRGAVGRFDLSIDDSQALGKRIMHVYARHGGTAYLESIGGLNYTGREGHKWVASHSKRDSDFVLARHFLYLMNERPKNRRSGIRFKVEGNPDAYYLKETKTSSDVGSLILEAVMNLVNSTNKSTFSGYSEEDGLWLTAREVAVMANKVGGPRITIHKAGRALKNISIDEQRIAMPLPSGGISTRKVFYRLDVKDLIQRAENDGFDTTALIEILKKTPGGSNG